MVTEAQVKTDIQNVVKFYDQIRLFGAINSGINNQNGQALTNLITQQGVCTAAFLGDFITQKNAGLDASRAAVASAVAGIAGVARWQLRDYAQVLNVPETDPAGILKRIYDDYNTNSKRVMSRGLTFGSISAGGSNQGNGVVVRVNVDENGYVLENQTADAKAALCVADATSGADKWEEKFELRSGAAAKDFLAITGSGKKVTVSGISARSGNILKNPSFSQTSPAGPTSSLTAITNWSSDQTIGTTFFDSIGGTGANGYYRDFPGDTTPLALRFKSNGTTGTFYLSQNLETLRSRFSRTTPYCVQLAWRRKSSATGTLAMSLGNQSVSVDISTGSNDTWNILQFTGTQCWFKNMDAAGLTFKIQVTSLATGNVDIDDVIVAPLTGFDGTWLGFLGTPATGNPSQWLLNDTFSWTDTELGEGYGLIQKFFCWRAFGVYLPAIPKAPTTDCTVALAGAGAGNVDNGAHSYTVTFVDGNSVESGFSTASHNAVTVTDKTTNGKVSVSAIPTGPSNTSSRKVYRSKAGTTTPFFLLTTISGNVTTTYTDNTADASLGAQASTVVASGISLTDPT